MKAQDIIKKKPYLIWYTKDYDHLSDEAVVEAILNYGDWDDVQLLIKTLGIKRVANIFREYSRRPRSNYDKKIARYFGLYFDRYA